MAIYLSGQRDDGTRDCFMSGRVGRDAKFEYTKNSGTPKASFSIAYGNRKFMNVVAIGNGAVTDLASRLEAGDIVLVAGTYSTRKYTGRDGTEKEWHEVLANFIAPQPSFADGANEENEASDQSAGQMRELNSDNDDGELPF